MSCTFRGVIVHASIVPWENATVLFLSPVLCVYWSPSFVQLHLCSPAGKCTWLVCFPYCLCLWECFNWCLLCGAIKPYFSPLCTCVTEKKATHSDLSTGRRLWSVGNGASFFVVLLSVCRQYSLAYIVRRKTAFCAAVSLGTTLGQNTKEKGDSKCHFLVAAHV